MNTVSVFARKYFSAIALIILIADLTYSFIQHYHANMDGDMASIIMPGDSYSHVMNDPLGSDALFRQEIYVAPNRYFAHAAMSVYFKTVPLMLQRFMNPIDSLYVSCAIAKTLIQAFIILLLSSYISGSINFFSKRFLAAAIIVTPLFHTTGYYIYTGVIDHSITYTFFFALPVSLLLLYFLPFYLLVINQKEIQFRFFWWLLWCGFALTIALNGPLNPGIVLTSAVVFISFVFISWYYPRSIPANSLNISKPIERNQNAFSKYFIPLIAFSGYSLYIGTFNAENFNNPIPLMERYSRLPEGLFNMVFTKAGFVLLIIAIMLNLFLLKKYLDDKDYKKIMTAVIFLAVFIIIYILLLPLGGYRNYRPDILRRDTFLPVTLIIFFLFGFTTLKLSVINFKGKILYRSVVFILLCIFWYADKPAKNETLCERAALKTIAETGNEIVKLESNCTVLSWEPVTDYRESEVNAKFLQYLKITKHKTRYYQQ